MAERAAIVTGASSGIGLGIARMLGEEGHGLTVVSRRPEKLEAAADELRGAGHDIQHVPANLGGPDAEDQIKAVVAAHRERFGRLDVLVNNAGIEKKMPFVDTPEHEWNEVIAINLTGPFLCSQRAAKQMIAQGDGGRIINVSSVHEDLPMPTNSPYCAAKGGLRMLMRTIAVELAPHKILVNNVAPGAVDTPMDASLKADPKEMDELLAEIPLGRMGKPEEIAEMCAFLASSGASYSTGSTFFVDGGLIRQSGSL